MYIPTGFHDCECLGIQRFQLEFKDLVTLGNSQRFRGYRKSWEKMHPDSETSWCNHNPHYQRGEGSGRLSYPGFKQELQGQGTGMQQRSRQSGQQQHWEPWALTAATAAQLLGLCITCSQVFQEQVQLAGNRWSPHGQVCRTCKTLLGSLEIEGKLGREVYFVTILVT